MGAAPLPLPPPLERTRGVVQKVMCPCSSRKLHAEAPSLAPCKALKVSASSTAQWVAEVQAAIQHGVASVRADLKEPVAQGEATEVATEQAEEEETMPCEAEAYEPDEAEASLVAEATEAEAEALRTSKAKATEAGASRTTKAEVAEELEAWSLGKSLFLQRERDVWDQLRWQKDLLRQCQRASGGAEHRGLEREASRAAEASRAKVQSWKEKAEGLEKEVSRAAEASVAVQAVLEAEIGEHNVLQSAALTTCEALEDDEEAKAEVVKLVEVAEAPGMALAKLFEEEVVSLAPIADAGDPKF
ncbi:uncharacterized protein [Miscanthus floridulus]|uniref:uncharacterized protein n=1 Tax=Miscanthus floridulus TaxID=154761 RepID=UPI00345B1614